MYCLGERHTTKIVMTERFAYIMSMILDANFYTMLQWIECYHIIKIDYHCTLSTSLRRLLCILIYIIYYYT